MKKTLQDRLQYCLVCSLVMLMLGPHPAFANRLRPLTDKKIKDATSIQKRDKIFGSVVDAQGKPLPGVSIKERNGKAVTSTNTDGKFIIDISKGSTIVVSSVGFITQEITYKGNANLKIVLQENNNSLNEILVVGYGKQKSITKTGAITSIKGADIRNTPSTNIRNMLVGKVSGFTAVQASGQPGSEGGDFYVRGISTEVGRTTPLILVDDIEISYDQFINIDPNEVESVSVLKDASASAIYGIKGANGAVLVTTRRGVAGKPVIHFSTQFAIQNPIQSRHYLDSYNSALLENLAYENQKKYNAVNGLSDGKRPFSDADLEAFRTHSDPYKHPDNNWNDILVRRSAPMTTSNIDVSGGSERIKYFVSVGYMNQVGLLQQFDPPAQYKNDKNLNNNYYYKRYNFRSNLDIKATGSLDLKLNINGSRDVTNQSTLDNIFNYIGSYFYLNPYIINIYNPDGSYGYNDGSINTGTPYSGNNLIGRLALGGYSRDINNEFNFNLGATQRLAFITPGLSLRANIAYTNNSGQNKTLDRGNSFPSFSYDPVTGIYTPRDPTISRVGLLAQTTGSINYLTRTTAQAAINYERSFGNHNVSALVLYNEQSESSYTNNVVTNLIPVNFRGFTSRLNYNYKEKYLLELIGAYNGTSRFTKHYGFFPALSAGYNLSSEPFFKNTFKFFDNFKIRGSWGIAGSDDIGSGNLYAYQDAYALGGGINLGETTTKQPNIYESKIGTNTIKWQQERKANLGIDFSLFKQKLSGSIDVFSNRRSDILYTRNTIPLFYGLDANVLPPTNLGIVTNKGYDIELKYRSQIGAVGFNIGALYSFAKNKIIEKDEPRQKYPWLTQTGQSLGVKKQFIFDGYYTEAEAAKILLENASVTADPAFKRTIPVPNGITPIAGMLKYRDLNGDGLINLNDDVTYTGKPNVPQSTGSLSLGANYKGFAFNVLFQTAFNYSFIQTQFGANPLLANWQPIHQKSWTPETASSAGFPILLTSTPGYMSAEQSSTYWSIDNAYYISFRSADLSYNLSNTFSKKIGLSTVKFTISASNICNWSNIYKKYQYNPEAVTNGGYSPYPLVRMINFGINIGL